jgi:hypothetical protein
LVSRDRLNNSRDWKRWGRSQEAHEGQDVCAHGQAPADHPPTICHPSIPPHVHPVYKPVHSSICLSLHLSIYPSFHLSPSTHLSIP